MTEPSPAYEDSLEAQNAAARGEAFYPSWHPGLERTMEHEARREQVERVRAAKRAEAELAAR